MDIRKLFRAWRAPAPPASSPGADSSKRFPTTSWSLIIAAGEKVTPESRAALDVLCERYWYPVYAYVRKKGYSAEEARDFTQDFFAHLLTKNKLSTVNAERGRFRAWLCTCVNSYMTDEWRKARTLKRGGGKRLKSIDTMSAEERYKLEPVNEHSAERLFERHWALIVLERTLDALRSEHVKRGTLKRFDALKLHLEKDLDKQTYKDIAKTFGTTEGNVKQWMKQFKERCHEHLRAEIAQTVELDGDVEDEIRHFRTLFG